MVSQTDRGRAAKVTGDWRVTWMPDRSTVRAFAWRLKARLLVRDYDERLDVSGAIILVAMGGNLLRRTTHP